MNSIIRKLSLLCCALVLILTISIINSCKKKEGVVGKINSIECSSVTNSGVLYKLASANEVASIIPYKAVGDGSYQGQTITSTGVTGLTATLEAGQYSGDGSFTYKITGTPDSEGTASFAINVNGINCTLEREVVLATGTIGGINCATATKNGTLFSNTPVSNASIVVSYSGGNAGTHGGQIINSTGVVGLTATLAGGVFAGGDGTLTYTISGTATTAGNANFNLNIGGQSCAIEWLVNYPVGILGGLNCSAATNSGTLTYNSPASGVKSVVSYTGSNGGIHTGQTVNSTGVGGLTATLLADTFDLGSGTLTYNITGTPTGVGQANFLLSIGGKSCTISRTVSAPPIGSTMLGGKLAYILQPGDLGYVNGEFHGLIAASSDYFSPEYNTYDFYINDDDAYPGYYCNFDHQTDTVIGSGATNTSNLASAIDNGEAASLQIQNAVIGGYSDWFIPSKLELLQLFLKKNQIGGFLDARYLTSSQVGTVDYFWSVLVINFTGNGTWEYQWKCDSLGSWGPSRVRPVRKF